VTSFALHLMRHGEPEGAGRLIGHADAAPTSVGIAACVERARSLALEVLVASDLSRARLAAEAIGGHMAMTPTTDPRWRELDFGAWDGRLPAEVNAAALARFWDDPDAHAPPGGESWSAILSRVSCALSELAARSTLVVTHAGTMRAALAALCGFGLQQAWAFDLPYAGLLSLRVWPGEGAEPRTAQIVALRP